MSVNPEKIVQAGVRAIAYGAVALVDPNRLSGWRKHAFWFGVAGASAAETALLPRAADPWRSPSDMVGEGALAAGITYGGHELWAKADAWLMDALATAGVKHPRVWYAAVSAALGAGVTFVDLPSPEEEWGDEQEFVEVPDGLRAIVRSLLNGIQGYGADELFAQLASARVSGGHGAWDFEVDEALPRTVISDYTFPVEGTFERAGAEHLVQLDVVDGRLGSLYVHTLSDLVEDVDVSLPDSAVVDFHLAREDARA